MSICIRKDSCQNNQFDSITSASKQLSFQTNQIPFNFVKSMVATISPSHTYQPVISDQSAMAIEPTEDNMRNRQSSQISTDVSSHSSSCDFGGAPYTSNFQSVFDDHLSAACMMSLQQQHSLFYNPVQKTASNEEVYFPRVFSHNIMDVQQPEKFLARHEITAQMRARMIDWMIEVLKAYNYSEATFSLSVAIMDHYFAKVSRSLQMQELHIIGVTCMFIASKYEEIVPFTLQKVYEKIAHEKIPMSLIKKTEADILATLNFELSFPTLATLSSLMIKYLETQEFFQGHSKEEKDVFIALNVYIFKLATFDYEIMSNYCFKTIAITSIFVTTTVMDHCFHTKFSFPYLHYLLDIIRLTYDSIIALFNRLLTLAQTFETSNPSLRNLKKHNLEEINLLSNKLPRTVTLQQQGQQQQQQQEQQQPQDNSVFALGNTKQSTLPQKPLKKESISSKQLKQNLPK